MKTIRSKNAVICRIGQVNLVLLFFILSLSFVQNSEAQLTTWELGPASDWNASYVVEGPTNASCDCIAGAEDRIIVYSSSLNNPEFEITRPHQNGSYGTTAVIPIGPGNSLTRRSQVAVTGALNSDPIFGCVLSCGDASFGPDLTFTTEALRPPASINYTWNSDGSATFTWDVTTDLPNLQYSLWIYFNGSVYSLIQFDKSIETITIPCPSSSGGTWGFQTQGGTTPGIPFGTYASAISNITLPARSNPLGKISGRITTAVGNAPVDSVAIEIELQNPNEISNASCWPAIYRDTTDSNGDYVVPFIYYGVGNEEADYKITPSLPLHGFNPGDIVRTLKSGDYIKTQDFIDTTSYVISGTISDSKSCGVDSTLIFTTSGSFVSTYSNPDGTYDLVVPQSGNYTIKAVLDTLELGTESINVISNTANHNFIYTETDSLSIFVGAGCFEPIGPANVVIRTKGGCLLLNTQTNASGYINNMVLPSREITVEVASIDVGNSGLDAFDIINDIGAPKNIDLDSNTTIEIFYRKPLSMEFSGVPAPPCPATPYPVFNQAVPYSIAIQVWESPGICPADTGYIIVQDNIASSGLVSTVLDTIPVSNGIALYTILPGEPTLAAPYLKFITFTAVVDSQMVITNLEGIVSGTRQRTATFVTGAPVELPYLILRDPPGDASYSFFDQNSTTVIAQSYSALVGGGVRVWAKASAEANIFGLKIFGEIGGGIAAGGSKTSSSEITTTLSNSLGIQTSSESSVIGENGDLVYGAAVNFVYGLADERIFDINTCQMTIDTGIVFSPDTFATTFFKTIKGIRDDLIPDLNFLATNPDTTEAARRKFRNEARKWEQVIQLNDELKEEALKNPIDNYTIESAAGPVTLSTSGSTSKKRSVEFTEYLNADIAASGGIDFFGAFTVEAGIEVTIRGEWGQTESNEITQATTTGFVFDDEGDGFYDNISFDYAVDDVYGTPVFGDPIGKTSCPHEPGTQYIDFPEIVAPIPVKYVELGNEVEFTLQLRNNSESDDTRTYELDFIEQSNQFGALVFNGANPFSGTIPFTIPAGGTATQTVRVVRSASSSQYSFEGLQFDLYPTCEPLLKSSTFVSAYFENTCPNITMPTPINDWIANESNNNLIPITMDDYVLDPQVDVVKLMYTEIGQIAWKTTNIEIPGPNLLAPPQTYNWDITDVPDGEYLIRWELNCGETVNVSTRICGKIDRSMPIVFGNEKPYNDAYFLGDEISVTFNEPINPANLNGPNVYFMAIPQNQVYPAQFIIENNKVKVVPGVRIDSMYNQKFEIGLVSVSDLYNNVRPDTVSWEFYVSEPDSDRDGVPDTKDRCPGGDDYKDTDMDGLPDDCDCVPTIKANGRQFTKAAMDFDGVNDYIKIPHNPELIPTATNAVTMEVWVYPTEATNEHGIITQSGNWPNRNHQILFNHASKKINVTGTGVSSLFSNDTIPYNKWSHIAVVFNLNETKLYINGELDNTRLQSLSAVDQGFDITIGNQEAGGPTIWNWKGQMDEMRYWNYARSQSEIQNSMNMELAGNEGGLEAYYNFNEGTPFGSNTDLISVNDISSNGHDGSMFGFTKTGTASNWVNSPVSILNAVYDICKTCTDTLNTALDFDGINDHLRLVGNSTMLPSPSSNVTIEAWVNPTAYPAIIVSSIEGVYLALASNGTIQVFTTTFVGTGPVIPKNEWTHLAYVFVPSGVTIYVNGNSIGFYAMTHSGTAAENLIGIGGNIDDQNYMMDGKMDDIRFWNYARTPGEIVNNLFTELAGDEAGLIAYFNFNNGSPSEDNSAIDFVPDVTSNFNDGFMSGFNKFGGFSNFVKSPLRFSGDVDEDGRPDVCDSCIPPINLMLENTSLNGTYIARDKITLGNGITFPANADVLFRTPELELFDSVNAQSGVKILVNPKPCNE